MSKQLYCEEFSGNMLEVIIMIEQSYAKLGIVRKLANWQILHESVFIEMYGYNVLVRKAKR